MQELYRKIGEVEHFKRILEFYCSPKNDTRLTEEDTRVIEEAWWRVYGPEVFDGRPRYYRDVNGQPVPISVEEEGYWYCPLRIAYQPIYGDRKPYTEIDGIHLAKTPMEAIIEAKRHLFNASMTSGWRNITNTEALLSGKLKFPGQDRSLWFPVQLFTDGEFDEFDRTARQWLKENGYQILD